MWTYQRSLALKKVVASLGVKALIWLSLLMCMAWLQRIPTTRDEVNENLADILNLTCPCFFFQNKVPRIVFIPTT